MKKITTVLLMAILPLVKAQITYNSGDYANSADQISYILGDTATLTKFSETGANHNWNFNSLQASSAKQIDLIDPNFTSYKEAWCQLMSYTSTCNSEFNNKANIGEKLTDLPIPEGSNVTLDSIYSHSLKTNTDLSTSMIGIKITSNNLIIPAILDYQQPDILYKFPMNYNDTYTEPFIATTDLSHLGISFKINTSGSRTNHVDGWGNLTVDHKTYNNVLRLKSISDQNITRIQDGITYQQSIKTISYQWLSKDYKFPVMEVKGLENNGKIVITEIRYLKNDPVLATSSENLKNIIVYPNPSNGNFKTNIPTSEIKSIEVYNTIGQMVAKSLDITNLEKGNYIIKINTPTKSHIQKVIKK